MLKNRKLSLIFTVVVALLVVATSAFALLSKKPIDLDKVDEKDIDKEILRMGIIAELDAVNLYEQMAATAKDERVRKIMLHTAKEEKTHVGEFQALLVMIDQEQKEELVAGERELMEELQEED